MKKTHLHKNGIAIQKLDFRLRQFSFLSFCLFVCLFFFMLFTRSLNVNEGKARRLKSISLNRTRFTKWIEKTKKKKKTTANTISIERKRAKDNTNELKHDLQFIYTTQTMKKYNSIKFKCILLANSFLFCTFIVWHCCW